jgi:hypothetical protein
MDFVLQCQQRDMPHVSEARSLDIASVTSKTWDACYQKDSQKHARNTDIMICYRVLPLRCCVQQNMSLARCHDALMPGSLLQIIKNFMLKLFVLLDVRSFQHEVCPISSFRIIKYVRVQEYWVRSYEVFREIRDIFYVKFCVKFTVAIPPS